MGQPCYLGETGGDKRRARRSDVDASDVVAIVESLEPRLMLAGTIINVDTFDDVVNANDGLTSLREAITLAADTPGDDTINLPAGLYALDPEQELGGLSIDDASGKVTIICEDQANPAQIDGQDDLRVFYIVSGSIVEMDNLHITNGYSNGDGGGIYNEGMLTITDSTVSGNQASDGGGIHNIGTMTLTNSTVSGNTANYYGGGIYSNGYMLTLINSTISGNSAGDSGGGILAFGPGVHLLATNCTIVNNYTEMGSGGGLAVQGSGVELYLDNNIIANNGAYFAPDILAGDGVFASRIGPDPTNNFIGTDDGHAIGDGDDGNIVGSVAYPADPMLGPLADNGGPTQTHQPQEYSQVIDAGNNAAAADAGLTLDQRGPGYDRIAGPAVDIGAVETWAEEDYGYGSIYGAVWDDADSDGVWDEDEVGLAGRGVYLDLDESGDYTEGDDLTTTDADGDYAFDYLDPGTYDIGLVYAPGWAQTFPTDPELHTRTVEGWEYEGGEAYAEFGLRDILATGGEYYEVWGSDTDYGTDIDDWFTGYVLAEDCTLLGSSDNANDLVYFAGEYDYYIIVTRAQVQVDAVRGSAGDYAETWHASSDWNPYLTGAPDGQYSTLGDEAYHGAYASITVLQNPESGWEGLTLYTGDISAAMHIGIEHNVCYDGMADPFWYEFELWVNGYGQASAVEFKAPDGQWRALWIDHDDGDGEEDEWEFWRDDFGSIAEMEAAFPQGVYSVRAITSFGQVETSFYFGDSDTQTPLGWPTQKPEILNPLHGQVDVPVDTLFQWEEITDPNTSGIYLEVENVQWQSVYWRHFWGEGTSETSTGPANLQPGQNYELDINNENTNWQTTPEGFGVHSGLSVENTAVFRTAGEPSPVLPDMAILDFAYPPGEYNPGDPFGFAIELGNIGEGNAIAFDQLGQAVPFYNEVRLSSDMVWGNADDILLFRRSDAWWMGGKTDTFETAEAGMFYNLPTLPDVPAGAYHLAVALDADGQIPETNEANNFWWSEAADFVVGDLGEEPPDLTVNTPAAEKTVVAGQQTSVLAFVRNQGEGPVAYDEGNHFDTTLHLRSDMDFNSQTDVAATVGIGRLMAPGQINPVTLSFTAPTTPGRYYLRIMTDRTEVVAETSEQNNWSDIVVLDVVNPTRVLSVGVRNGPVKFAGDIAARQMWTSLGLCNAVTTNQLLEMDAANAGNRAELIAAIDNMKTIVAPGDTFVFYIASQACSFVSGDELPVEGQYNTTWPNWDKRQIRTGDEYLYLSTANDGPGDILTDDDLAELFVDEAWDYVNKVFIVDTSYSDGFYGSGGEGDSGDLSQLPNMQLLAAAQQDNFAWMMMNKATKMGINTFGTAIAATLGQFRQDTSIDFEQVFVQANEEGSVFRDNIAAPVFASMMSGWGFGGASQISTRIGTNEATWASYIDADGSTVRVKMSAGQGNLTFAGANLLAETRGSTTYITGENVSLDRIDITYSSAKGSLSVYVRGGDGLAEIDTIAGLNPLGSLKARQVTLTGGIEMLGDGYIQKLQLGDVIGGADITMTGTGPARGVTITAGRIGPGTEIILSNTPVKSFKAISWAPGGALVTPWLGSLKITGSNGSGGDFGANVTTTGSNKGWGVGKASIAGDISGAWNVAVGGIKDIRAKGNITAKANIATANGPVKSARSGGDFLGSLSAGGDAAGWIASLRAGGNFGADVHTAGQSRGYGLKAAKIAGDIIGGSWQVDAGGVNKITAASSQAGWSLNTNGFIRSLYFRNDFRGQVVATEWLGRIKVRGNMEGASVSAGQGLDSQAALADLRVYGLMSNSDVLVAGWIKKITVGAVTGSNVFASVDTAGLANGAVPALDSLLTGGRIDSFTTRGLASQANSFVNSRIVADWVGKVKLASSSFDEGGDDFGVVANRLDKFDTT